MRDPGRKARVIDKIEAGFACARPLSRWDSQPGRGRIRRESGFRGSFAPRSVRQRRLAAGSIIIRFDGERAPNIRSRIQRSRIRDEQEVAGYAEVMETVFQAWADIPITENHIKQLHGDLLAYSEKDDRHRGEYKKLRNDVGAFDAAGKMIGIVFETATPFDTPWRRPIDMVRAALT